MQDTEASDGREEQDGAAGASGNHVTSAGLRDKKGACEVDVEEVAEHGGVVGFRFDIGASLLQSVSTNNWMKCMHRWTSTRETLRGLTLQFQPS